MPSANEKDSDNLPCDLPSDSLVEEMCLAVDFNRTDRASYLSTDFLQVITEARLLPDEFFGQCCDTRWNYSIFGLGSDNDTILVQDVAWKMKKDTLLADVECILDHCSYEHYLQKGDTIPECLKNHCKLSIIKENGRWVLDNVNNEKETWRCLTAADRNWLLSDRRVQEVDSVLHELPLDEVQQTLQDEENYFKQYPVPADSLLPDSSILQLFSAIPSYEPGKPEVFHYDSLQMRAAFSDSLYALTQEAFQVWGIDFTEPISGIWLNGLVCGWHHGFYGNRDDSMHIVGVRQEYVNDSLKASVRVIFRTYDEKPVVGRYVEHYFHSFKLYLKQESGQWVIDNFEVRPMTREEIPGKPTATDMKALCRHYIDEERKWMKDEGWMRAWRKDCADQRQKLMQDSVANADALRRHDEFVRQSEEYFKGL
jgi:hypothetical protein